MKIDGSAVRAGMVLELEGKLWLVTKHEIRTPGNLRAFNQVVLQNIEKGTKDEKRLNSGAMVERVSLDDKIFQYLFEDGEQITLMDPQSYEQITMPKSLLGAAAPFLQDEMMIGVQLHEGKPLSASLPETVIMEIVEADPVVKNQTASSSYKPAKLTNGVRVMVPPFIGTGTKIVVRTADSTYVEKSETGFMIVYTPLLSVMTTAAFKAAKGLVRDFGEVGYLQVSKKGSNNFVTNADLKAEKTIRVELQKARPKFGFLLEEGGEVKGEDETQRWVVDPLDGTNNFIHAVPLFCISIGLEKTYNTGRKEIIAGVVYDPLRDEMFTAEKHKGAFLNGRRIQVSGRNDLTETLLGTGIPRKGKADYRPALAMLNAVTENASGARSLGASALELAYVAAGRMDGYWHTNLQWWDIAAGLLLVEEAGGKVTDIQGGNNMLTSGQVLASNTYIHEKLKTILNSAK